MHFVEFRNTKDVGVCDFGVVAWQKQRLHAQIEHVIDWNVRRKLQSIAEKRLSAWLWGYDENIHLCQNYRIDFHSRKILFIFLPADAVWINNDIFIIGCLNNNKHSREIEKCDDNCGKAFLRAPAWLCAIISLFTALNQTTIFYFSFDSAIECNGFQFLGNICLSLVALCAVLHWRTSVSTFSSRDWNEHRHSHAMSEFAFFVD